MDGGVATIKANRAHLQLHHLIDLIDLQPGSIAHPPSIMLVPGGFAI
jgi:hypothetical protein